MEIASQKEIENNPQVFKIIKGVKSARVVVMENMPINNSFGKMKKAEKQKLQKTYALQCIARHEEQQHEWQSFCDRFGYENKTAGQFSFIIAYQKSLLSGKKAEGKYKKSNYNKRKKTRSSIIWDIVKNNFDETNTVYWTLTYSTSHQTANDLTTCLKDFKKFRETIGRKYSHFQYITTFAQQQNGNWHFHMLCNVICLSEQKVSGLWKYGKVKKHRLNTVKDITNVTKYLVKNMQSAEESLQSKKGYLCSQNLSRSQVLRSWNEEESDACIEEFEQLKGLPKRVLYDVEKPCGAVVELEYPSQTVKSFVAERSITSDTIANIVERISSKITAVSVIFPARTAPALIATKKKI